MSLTLLRFKGFSEIYGNDGLGLLVLTTEDETRQLSVVCDRWTLRQFTLRQRLGGKGEVLLPEVLWTAISRYTDLSFEIRITGLRDGEWVAYLYNMALQQALRLQMLSRSNPVSSTLRIRSTPMRIPLHCRCSMTFLLSGMSCGCLTAIRCSSMSPPDATARTGTSPPPPSNPARWISSSPT